MGTPALSPTEQLTKRVETLEVRLNDALGHLAELEQLFRVEMTAHRNSHATEDRTSPA